MPHRTHPTAAYYEDHAAAFFADTATVDLAPLYARFLAHLPAESRILDAGCGSGRDALKLNGTLYASFKYGRGEREHGGRRFTDLDETGLAALLAASPAFTALETWTTADQRPGREDEQWLNTLLARTERPLFGWNNATF